MSAEDFAAKYQDIFMVCKLSNGTDVELVPDGAKTPLSLANLD